MYIQFPGSVHSSPRRPLFDRSRIGIGSSTLQSWIRRDILQRTIHRPPVTSKNYGRVKSSSRESEMWHRREEESREAGIEINVAPSGEWSWTFNWDRITEQVLVGSCPRSVEDINNLVEGGCGCTAMLCLQCNDCLEALSINRDVIRDAGVAHGLVMAHVPIRDFDHEDQSLMLQEAVRVLHLLIGAGHTVYVHCTAGINRANLTVLGYLTFCKGWNVSDASLMIRSARPVSNPYIDCWQSSRDRLLAGREETLRSRARRMYAERTRKEGQGGHASDDWNRAQTELTQELFTKLFRIDFSIISSITDIERSKAVTLSSQVEELRLKLAKYEELLNESNAALLEAQRIVADADARILSTMSETASQNFGSDPLL